MLIYQISHTNSGSQTTPEPRGWFNHSQIRSPELFAMVPDLFFFFFFFFNKLLLEGKFVIL
jgi:hypothetical protein